MTDYTPFQEPQTDDSQVIVRRTWEELRRIGTVVDELAAGSGGGGDTGNAAFSIGFTNNVQNYAPGVTTPTQATRIPLQTTTKSLNVTMQPNAFQPLQDGDYYVDYRLTFAPNGNNEIWYTAVFQNDVQISVTLEVNNESLTTRYSTVLAGAIITANDLIDIRLWPQFASDTGTIELCEFFLGGIQTLPAEELPGSDHEQRITDLENQMAIIGPKVQANETAISALQLDVSDLQTRVFDLEQIQQVLLDGVYGSGQTTDLAWSPGTTTPTAATRLPIQTYTVQSNVVTTEFTIQALFDADYFIDLSLTFTGDQNNRDWTVAIFENGVQQGNGFEFNTRDTPRIHVTGSYGLHLTTTDIVDVRLWPTNAGNTGTVDNYTANLILLGLDDTIT